jgi:CGNR zinc finger/Putative stress-induced transcription regulator
MPVQPSSDAMLLHALVNTLDRRTFMRRGQPNRTAPQESLGTPQALRGWLEQHNLLLPHAQLDEADLSRVLDLRTALRAAFDRQQLVESSPVEYTAQLRLSIGAAAGPHLRPTGPGIEQAIGEICTAALRIALTGEWGRLRVCAATDCHWVFYDRSKPGRGRYCAPDTCGNRAKTRDYRRRKHSDQSGRRAGASAVQRREHRAS